MFLEMGSLKHCTWLMGVMTLPCAQQCSRQMLFQAQQALDETGCTYVLHYDTKAENILVR
jgi:hypothetical protein